MLYTHMMKIFCLQCAMLTVYLFTFIVKTSFHRSCTCWLRGTVGQIVTEMVSHLNFELSDLSVVIGQQHPHLMKLTMI